MHERLRFFETASAPRPEIDVHIERPFNFSELCISAQPDRRRPDFQELEENGDSEDLRH